MTESTAHQRISVPQPHGGVLRMFAPGESGNPRGRPTLGATVREWLNQYAANGLTDAELRKIHTDKSEPSTRRAAALRMLRYIESGDISDFDAWLHGEARMPALRSLGLDTGIVKKAKIKRTPTKYGESEEREIELHDRSGSDFDRVMDRTDGKPSQTINLEGNVPPVVVFTVAPIAGVMPQIEGIPVIGDQ